MSSCLLFLTLAVALILKAEFPSLPVSPGLSACVLTRLLLPLLSAQWSAPLSVCCHRSSFSPPCRGSGAVIWNEAVWCVVSDGLLDTAHILFFVPAEDGGWRLIPTSYSLEVPYAPPRLKRTEISWWVFVVAHIYLHLFCSTGRTADCCLLMCLRGWLQESCWFHRLKACWSHYVRRKWLKKRERKQQEHRLIYQQHSHLAPAEGSCKPNSTLL